MNPRRRIDPSKPLVEMSRAEPRDAFDEIGLGLNFRLLEDARHSESERTLIARCILVMAGGVRRIVLANNEYGDGEAIGHIDDFIEEIGRAPVGLLLPGEYLEREIVEAVAFVPVAEVANRRRA